MIGQRGMFSPWIGECWGRVAVPCGSQRVRPVAACSSAGARYSTCCAITSILARSYTRTRPDRPAAGDHGSRAIRCGPAKAYGAVEHSIRTRNASAHLLTGLLFDDYGHRMVPTHATKAGVRYRYYVSLPPQHGKSKTASVRSVSRVPAADIEDTIVKLLKSI